jgi:hypothetical protein
LAIAGCGSDDVGPAGHAVGARCSADKDCAKRCLIGAPFPSGYCSQTCTSAKDCPGGSACVAVGGAGVCMVPCHVANDCNGFGPGYLCSREPRQEGGEGLLVCAGG